MTVEQSIDRVEIARTAASGAYCERTGELRLRAGRESCNLLMADMDPFDPVLAPDRVSDAVEAVADDAVDTLHAGRCQGFGELVCDGLHALTFSSNSIGFSSNNLATKAESRS